MTRTNIIKVFIHGKIYNKSRAKGERIKKKKKTIYTKATRRCLDLSTAR